jgi:short-subunit dehydrogenase
MTDNRPSTVWITGASTGIGAALAQNLARAGNVVAISARSADKLAALAAQTYGTGRIVAYPADVTDGAALKATVEKIVAELGSIDTAVLSAGTYTPDKPGQFDAADIEAQFSLNVIGTVKTLDALLPALRRQGRGHIAIIASVAGYRGLPMAAGYGATKAALINMAEALKLDFANQNIRLQVICPGFVKTPLTDKNDFPMPFIIPAEKAAELIAQGLQSNRFEIAFPWQLVWLLKLLRILPYWLYFPLIAKQTGAGKTG